MPAPDFDTGNLDTDYQIKTQAREKSAVDDWYTSFSQDIGAPVTPPGMPGTLPVQPKANEVTTSTPPTAQPQAKTTQPAAVQPDQTTAVNFGVGDKYVQMIAPMIQGGAAYAYDLAVKGLGKVMQPQGYAAGQAAPGDPASATLTAGDTHLRVNDPTGWLSTAGSAVSDVATGVGRADKYTIGAGLNFAQSLADLGRDIALQIGGPGPDPDHPGQWKWLSGDEVRNRIDTLKAEGQSPTLEMPDPLGAREANSTTGAFLQGMTQFALGYVLAGGIKGLSGASSTTGAIAQNLTKMGISDFVSFEGLDPNFANLLKDGPTKDFVANHPGIAQDVINYLAVDPGHDSELEGRLKKAVAGLPLNIAAETLMGGLHALKVKIRETALSRIEAARPGQGPGGAIGDAGPVETLQPVTVAQRLDQYLGPENAPPVGEAGPGEIVTPDGRVLKPLDYGGIPDQKAAEWMDKNTSLGEWQNPAILQAAREGTLYSLEHGSGGQDALGFTSKALDAAHALKQDKGTPEQMRAQLRSAGVKEAELKATNLDSVFEGKSSVTKAEIIKHLEDHRIGLQEKVYSGSGFDYDGLPQPNTKWSQYSLDPSNPTYRETVLHLPSGDAGKYNDNVFNVRASEAYDAATAAGASDDQANRLLNDIGAASTDGSRVQIPEAFNTPVVRRAVDAALAATMRHPDFLSGHWDDPNVIAHARTQILTDAKGRKVFNIDELQSDWGQKLRDGGVRDEAKIAELRAKLDTINAERPEFVYENGLINTNAVRDRYIMPYLNNGLTRDEASTLLTVIARSDRADGLQSAYSEVTAKNLGDVAALKAKIDRIPNLKRGLDEFDAAVRSYFSRTNEQARIKAELHTAEASAPGHPLVATTDQWTTTALRRLIRQAVESGADAISFTPGKVNAFRYPEGETRLKGMQATYDEMYPRTLGKLLSKMDPSIKQDTSKIKAEKYSGDVISFPLTDKVKQVVARDGQTLFSFAGEKAAQALSAKQRPAAKQAIAMAKDMELHGATRDDIWAATTKFLASTDPSLVGVYRGKDGKWRIELDDSEASVAFGKGKRIGDGWLRKSPVAHAVWEDAYPKAAGKTKVEITNDTSLPNEGGFTPSTQSIAVNSESAARAKSSVLHEMQHVAQGEEGFATGGNVFGFNRAQIEREAHRMGLDDAHGLNYLDAQESLYRRLAGEVEARNVQKRLEMPLETRRKTPPWKTQDTPDELQILRANAASVQASLEDVRFSAKAAAAKAELRTQIEELGKRLPEGVSLRLSDNKAGGVAGSYDPLERLVYVSLAADNPARVFRHEEVHALRDVNLISDPDWALLTAHADKKGYRKAWGIDEKYAKAYADKFPDAARREDVLNEETVAEMVARYNSGEKFGSKVDAVLKRVKDFLRKVRDVLGVKGFRTVDDVLESIEKGDYAGKPGEAGSGGPSRLSVDTQERPPPLPGTLLQEPPKRVFWNPRTINTREDIYRVMDQLSQADAGAIMDAKRGVVTDKAAISAAHDMNPFDMLMADRPKDAPILMSKEQIIGARRFTESLAQRYKQAMQVASETGDPAAIMAWKKLEAIYLEMARITQGAQAEAGRALQAHNVPVGPDALMLHHIDGMLEQMGGHEFQQAVAKAEVAMLNDPEGGWKAVTDFAKKSQRARTFEALRWYITQAYLTSPHTHIRNFIGNTTALYYAMFERKAAGVIGEFLDPIDGVKAGEASSMWQGHRLALIDMLRSAARYGRLTAENKWAGQKLSEAMANASKQAGAEQSADRIMGKLEIDPYYNPMTSAYQELNPASVHGKAVDLVGKTFQWPGYLMGKSDEAFKALNRGSEYYALALRQATADARSGLIADTEDAIANRYATYIKNPTDDMQLGAQKFAEYNTFNSDPGPFVKKLMALRHFAENSRAKGDEASVGARLFELWIHENLPFVRTPGNLLGYTWERTALGVLRGQFQADIAKGGAARDLALAKVGLGSLLTTTFLGLAREGVFTGMGPDNYAERAHKRAGGWMPYAYRIQTDTKEDGTPVFRYFAINNMDPIGFWANTAASLNDVVKAKTKGLAEDVSWDEIEEVQSAMWLAAAKQFMDKSMMMGLSNVVDALHDPGPRAEKFFQSQVTSFIPSGVGYAARQIDPTQRQVTNMLEAIKAKLPVLRNSLEPTLTFWGKPVDLSSGLGKAYDMIVPLYSSSTETKAKIDREFQVLEYFPMHPKTWKTPEGVVSLKNEPKAYNRLIALTAATKASDLVEQTQRDMLQTHGQGNKEALRRLKKYGDMTLKEVLEDIVAGNRTDIQHDHMSYSDIEDSAKGDPSFDAVEAKKDILRQVLGDFRKAAKIQVLREFPTLKTKALDKPKKGLTGETTPYQLD